MLPYIWKNTKLRKNDTQRTIIPGRQGRRLNFYKFTELLK